MTEIFYLLVLLLLSAVFSGSETALISISMARAESLFNEGKRGARALYRLKADSSRMLITILIGNNLVNIGAASMATVVATEWFGHIGPGLAVGTLTILILLFGEITPKSFATRYSERISLLVAPFILLLSRAIYPLVWIFSRFTAWIHRLSGLQQDPTVTESELIRMAGHGEQEGTIAQEQRELIERVFAINDLTVRDVMTPQAQVYSLEGSLSVKDVLAEVMGQSYTRIPIYLDQPDEIHSILYLRDLLEAVVNNNVDARLMDIAHEPEFVPEHQPIDELIATLRLQSRHMAVVVDEYGTIRGVVTLEDLMEELVGEIYDESDVTPAEVSQATDGGIEVAGTTEVRIIEEFFNIDLPGKHTDTINHWILSHTERIPNAREEFRFDGLVVTIEKASKRRIEQVLLHRDESVVPEECGDDSRHPQGAVADGD